MLLSIITPTIDSAHYIAEAISSVQRDDLPDTQHIIIHDGGDDYVSALTNRYPHLEIVRGAGAGATAALVRGVDAARGDFILELNSDDRLAPGALARFSARAAARPDVRIWSGGARIFAMAPDGREVSVRKITSRESTKLSLLNVLDDVTLGSARFVHRSIFSEIGNFDPGFSECSDREFFLRAVLAGIEDAPLDHEIAELRQHAGSRSMSNRPGEVPLYFSQHVEIAEMWLAREDIMPEARDALRKWRVREVLRLAFYQARCGHLHEAVRTLAREDLNDPAWYLAGCSAALAWRRRRRK